MKIRSVSPGPQKKYLFGALGILSNEKILNFRHLKRASYDRFRYFSMEFWRFHGSHSEITDVSPLLLLNYGLTELAHLTIQITEVSVFFTMVGNTEYVTKK